MAKEFEIKEVLSEEEKDNLVITVSEICGEIVAKESDKAFKNGFREGLIRHTWQRDGVTYVGNGTYTLSQAVKMASDEGLIDNVL